VAADELIGDGADVGMSARAHAKTTLGGSGALAPSNKQNH
jgi:hypothetical protein